MKPTLFLLRTYYRLLSMLAPAIAAKSAFELFQKAKGRVRQKEQEFFKLARHFQVTSPNEIVDCYEIGNPDGKLVFMIHGWESNVGSMAALGQNLAQMGYRVISFNLPAHGSSQLKKANLIISSCTFLSVIDHLKPKEPFSVVSHSFGSAVTAYALSLVTYEVDKLAFLTTPNKLSDIFREFGDLIGLGNKAYQKMLQLAEALLGEPIEDVNVEDRIKGVNYNELLLIHDLFDKVLSHKNSLAVHKAAKRSRLATVIKVGHYRMLWDEKVLDQVKDYFVESHEMYVKAS